MPKILIIDDSDILRLELKELLVSHGHEVLQAENGFKAIQTLKTNSDVSIIISDINMPDLDGLSFCQKIRETEELKNLPVIIVSSESSREMRKQGKELGVVAWVVKPYHPQSLLSAVEKILASSLAKK